MRTFLLCLLLSQVAFGQEPDVLKQWAIDQEELRVAKLRAEGKDRPRHGLVVLVARYEDGTPALGWIGCETYWWKHQDCPKGENDCKREGAENYMFRTDSRGHMILNPSFDMLDGETQWKCTARDRAGREGANYLVFFDGEQHVITIRRQP